jgi:hypothetical protein
VVRDARTLATFDFESLLSDYPNTTAGVDRFGKLPLVKTAVLFPLERASWVARDDAMELRQRWLAASEHHDEAARRELVPVTLEFRVVERDVVAK